MIIKIEFGANRGVENSTLIICWVIKPVQIITHSKIIQAISARLSFNSGPNIAAGGAPSVSKWRPNMMHNVLCR